MISYYTIFTILLCHYIFDFILQTHWQAANKSKNNIALLSHVLTYTVGIIVAATLNFGYFSLINVAIFILLNSCLHFVTDYFTSRVSCKLFSKDWHNFFVVVGGDQLCHYLTLFGTFALLRK